VKRTQADQFGGRLIGSELANPDFVALANSFGIAATRVETPTELTAVISSVSLQPDSGKPFLVEVPVGPMPTP
jgi:acetolactate synthase-1/2/3 large subunit